MKHSGSATNEVSPVIKIAHLQLLPLLSGVQRVTLQELTSLAPDTYRRTLICQTTGPLTKLAVKEGIRCETVPTLTRPISPWNDLRSLLRLWRLMRSEKFDIVHTHSSKTGVLGRLAARCAGTEVIAHTVHGFAFPAEKSRWKRKLYAWMEYVGGKCCDVVICLNSNDLRIAENLGISRRKLKLLPNGVDLSLFAPISSSQRDALRARLNLPSDQPIAVMVGRLWPQKAPLTFVRAAIDLVAKHDEAHFVLVGDGELRPEVEAAIDEAGAGDRIHLLGWRDDVAELLPAFDVFVLPSLWEGMPLAILEALACGLPAIVSDIPGNRDLVNDREDGLTFPTGDVKALAEHLQTLLFDNCRRQQMGSAARRKVEVSFNLSTRIEKLLEVYSSISCRGDQSPQAQPPSTAGG